MKKLRKYKVSDLNGLRFIVRSENREAAKKEALKISKANQVSIEEIF